MFDKFLKYVHCDNEVECNSIEEFLEYTSGKTFLNGLYTILKKDDIEKWNNIIAEYFPEQKNSFTAFAYDWIGRIYTIDNNSNTIKLFDPADCNCYISDLDIVEFHNEIIDDLDEYLLLNFFNKWFEKNDHKIIKYGNCVGYILPLFLNGKHEVDNLEECDMDVYWTITLDIYKSIN